MIQKENLFSLQMRYLDSSDRLLYGHQIINGQFPNLKQDEWSIKLILDKWILRFFKDTSAAFIASQKYSQSKLVFKRVF